MSSPQGNVLCDFTGCTWTCKPRKGGEGAALALRLHRVREHQNPSLVAPVIRPAVPSMQIPITKKTKTSPSHLTYDVCNRVFVTPGAMKGHRTKMYKDLKLAVSCVPIPERELTPPPAIQQPPPVPLILPSLRVLRSANVRGSPL